MDVARVRTEVIEGARQHRGPLALMPQLDGLRAFAVMLVLVSHIGFGDWQADLIDTLDLGRVGVRIFFVLSGYLITRILLRQRAEIRAGAASLWDGLRTFYGRRALRIFPLFYVTIALAWSLDVGNLRSVVLWHVFYLSNLGTAMFTSLDGHGVLRDPTTAHFWSLAVEEQFYLLWPAIVFLAPRNRLVWGVLGMVCLAPLWRLSWYAAGMMEEPLHLLSCLDTLGAGALLAMYQEGTGERRERWRRWARPAWYLGCALLILCYAWALNGIWHRVYVILIDSALAVIGVALVCRAAEGRSDIFGRVLDWSPLRYVGRISYGIYILHAFMGPLLEFLIRSGYWPRSMSDGWARAASLYLLTLVAAALSWRLLEVHFNRLKGRLFPTRKPRVEPALVQG